MTTLTIEIPDKVEKTVTDLIEHLGGKVLGADPVKKLSKAARKKQILDDLDKSIEFVKLHREGKIESKSIEQLLSEL